MIWMLGPIAIALLVSVATAAVLLVLVNVNFTSKKGQRLDKVLASYARVVGAGEAAELAADAPKQVRFVFWKKFTRDIDEKLAGAGLEYTSQSWITGSLAVSILVFALASAFFGNLLIGFLMAGIVGFYLLNAFLVARVKARAVKFADELPQVLQILASGLRAGLTFQVALGSTAAQDRGEVGRQLRRAIAEVQFGSNLEDALKRVSQRMSSDDLLWLVMALEIQREIGGSLSHILDGVASTIKSRAEIQREIRVISAEGRMSGYILIALPIFSFISLFVIRPEYVSFFWSNPAGFAMMGVFIALLAVGWIWMSKVVAVRV